MQNQEVTFGKSGRRFGIELEYNAFDNLNRSVSENDLPYGIYFHAEQIKKALRRNVEVNKWHYTNNNSNWVLKPDASCGLEVCSPPLCGEMGINEIKKVVESLLKSGKANADLRCSFHVHVEIADFNLNDLVNLFKLWSSHELFFYFLTTPFRWLNQYCQPIGFSIPRLDEVDIRISDVLEILGDYKYYAINLYHYKKGRKKTVEFRIMGNEACMDPEIAAIWCRLMVCFVDTVKNIGSVQGSIEYRNLTETLECLNLQKYFGQKDIQAWMIERFSRLMDYSHLFDKCKHKRYIWEHMIISLQNQFHEVVKKLEEQLL
jgi:hypothetical protein